MTGGPQLMIRLCPERCSEEHTCIKGTGGGASGSNAQQVDHQPVFLQISEISETPNLELFFFFN